MGGREPLSLLRGRGCFLMWHASSESLMCKFSCWSRMVTSLQSTLWPALHACSANADELKSAILIAFLSCARPPSYTAPLGLSYLGDWALCAQNAVDHFKSISGDSRKQKGRLFMMFGSSALLICDSKLSQLCMLELIVIQQCLLCLRL